MTRAYVGVDDTDIDGSPGTGRVARGLMRYLEAQGFGTSQGVTRHQLLLHPAIPFTSHNSALCLGLELTVGTRPLERACREYLTARAVEGADPALCVAEEAVVTPAVHRLGERAKVSVLTVADARSAVDGTGAVLRSIAGDPQGVIGALAAVGLRAQGSDGRYVDLPGIREIRGMISVECLLRKTAVVAVTDADGVPLAADEKIDSQDWIRPSLVRGVPVLRVRRDVNSSKRWVPYERRSRSSLDRR